MLVVWSRFGGLLWNLRRFGWVFEFGSPVASVDVNSELAATETMGSEREARRLGLEDETFCFLYDVYEYINTRSYP